MKIASIDIGTNTILLLIAEIKNNKIIAIRNEHRVPRIGMGLKESNNISTEKIKMLFNILSEYIEIIRSYKCEIILAIGTNAFRIASNASSIVSTIKDKLGIQINIVTSLKEAELSFQGAMSSFNYDNNDNLVIDIGGGSTELISGKLHQIININSFQTGAVSGTEVYFKHDPPLPKEIYNFDKYLSSTFVHLKFPQNVRAIAIAGTPTTLVCILKDLKLYNEDAVEGSILLQDDVYILKEELSHLSSYEIQERYPQVVSGREDVLLAGTIILYKLMKLFNLTEVLVSTKGVRYGAIVDYIDTNFK